MRNLRLRPGMPYCAAGLNISLPSEGLALCGRAGSPAPDQLRGIGKLTNVACCRYALLHVLRHKAPLLKLSPECWTSFPGLAHLRGKKASAGEEGNGKSGKPPSAVASRITWPIKHGLDDSPHRAPSSGSNWTQATTCTSGSCVTCLQ